MSGLAPAPGFGQADLTNCDREPIHIPGSIQPHGLLLALDPDTLAILQAAGDAGRLLGWPDGRLLGAQLGQLLPPETLAAIIAARADDEPPSRIHMALEATLPDGRVIDLILHRGAAGLMLEIEPLAAAPATARPRPLPIVQAMVSRVAAARSLAEACQTAADEVRRVTGFDRVMVYRFQPDGSGAVVAEARDADLSAFLGLHYPASDVPRQARELYLRSWLRLIPDIGYVPAPIEPALSPLTGAPPDLSHCGLRSVSPPHLEYLAN
ncbi:MAG: histidine kinase, partial [Paracraurococcus sp.]